MASAVRPTPATRARSAPSEAAAAPARTSGDANQPAQDAPASGPAVAASTAAASEAPDSAVHPRFQVPHRAEVALAAIVILLVLTVDLRGAIGFSSFGVLLYYLVANLSAWTQTGEDRLYPRWLQLFGAVACVVLVAALPWVAVVSGVGVLLLGVAVRVVRLRWSAGPKP